MKDIAVCGANCTDCNYSNQCKGCNVLNGIPFGEQEICPVFQCATQEKNVDCFDCDKFSWIIEESGCKKYKTNVIKRYEKNFNKHILDVVNRSRFIKHSCFKDITDTLTQIQQFEKSTVFDVVKINDSRLSKILPIQIIRDKEGLLLRSREAIQFREFFEDCQKYKRLRECCFITANGIELKTEPFTSPIFPSVLECRIEVANFEKPKKYYRAVFRLDKIPKFEFDVFENCHSVMIVNGNIESNTSFSLMRCRIENYEFDIFKNDKYFFIDSTTALENVENFEKYVDTISIAFGFFKGYFIRSERYILSSEFGDLAKVSFNKYEKLTDSIVSREPAILTSEWKLNQEIFTRQDSAKSIHSVVDECVFNAFLAKIYGDKEENKILQEMLFVMFLGATYSLDTQPICFSVLLEGLRNYLEQTDKDINKNQYIKNDESEKLKKVLKDAGYSKKKINEYVGKIFRLSNDKKLIEPLIKYGVIKKEDEAEFSKILINRNYFLHGRFNILIKGATTPLEEINIINPISFTKYALSYMLILKIIGYKGYVLNYKKLSYFWEGKDYDKLDNMIEI